MIHVNFEDVLNNSLKCKIVKLPLLPFWYYDACITPDRSQ